MCMASSRPRIIVHLFSVLSTPVWSLRSVCLLSISWDCEYYQSTSTAFADPVLLLRLSSRIQFCCSVPPRCSSSIAPSLLADPVPLLRPSSRIQFCCSVPPRGSSSGAPSLLADPVPLPRLSSRIQFCCSVSPRGSSSVATSFTNSVPLQHIFTVQFPYPVVRFSSRTHFH
jgi:hypothetical protein